MPTNSDDEMASCEARLVDLAREVPPARLRRLATHVLAPIRHRVKVLLPDPATLAGGGTWSGRITSPDLHAHLLKDWLEHYSSPRRPTPHRARLHQPPRHRRHRPRRLPLVLDGASVPFDLGRTQRLFSRHQALALSARHDTCAADGCDRPFAWCELHHLRPWSPDGRTDLDNAVPLCGHNHRRIHDPLVHWWMTPDGALVFGHRWPSRRRQTLVA